MEAVLALSFVLHILTGIALLRLSRDLRRVEVEHNERLWQCEVGQVTPPMAAPQSTPAGPHLYEFNEAKDHA